MRNRIFKGRRQLCTSVDKNRHVGFGSGPHVCLGIHLARLEGEVALDVLFRRYPHLAIEGEADNVKWISRAGLRGLKRLPLALSR